jgi:DNA-binding LacI/PurR family transcriptional regulator
MARKSVTLKAIADRAGVSTATVSRALNDQPGVAAELRARILEIAGDMGYRPHLAARSLATSVTRTVSFVVRKAGRAATDDPFYPIIMAGAEAHLSQNGYHILLTTVDEQTMAQPDQFPVVHRGMVDGLILAGPDIEPSFIVHMITAGVPIVLVDNCLSQTAVNCVLNDDVGGTYAATRHLQEHGHTKIGFLSGPKEWVSNRERARGYRQAIEEKGLEPFVIYESETTIFSGERAMQRALEAQPELTAVCAVNDSVAIGAIRAGVKLGRRTPQDVAVFGFDDISWAEMNEPPLSTVRVFKRRMGELAAQRILDCIQNPDAAPVRVLVSTELVLRKSCG